MKDLDCNFRSRGGVDGGGRSRINGCFNLELAFVEQWGLWEKSMGVVVVAVADNLLFKACCVPVGEVVEKTEWR